MSLSYPKHDSLGKRVVLWLRRQKSLRKKVVTFSINISRVWSQLKREYEAELQMYEQVLAQTRGTKNKIYSLHEPLIPILF